MLRLERASKSFGGQVLLEDVDWFLADRDRVGLIGRNGTGKSTLLRILAGQDSPDRGAVRAPRDQTVGYLPQFAFEAGEGTLFEQGRAAFGDLMSWRRERDAIEERLAAGGLPPEEAEALLHRHAHLEERFHHHDGYEVDRKVHQVLTGLGFAESDFERPVSQFSGGWQMRASLARLLLLAPDVLLLDEPTNHLDIEARVWLEGFLADYPGGFILVSHDRVFLDRTVTRITEIFQRRLADYQGGYSSYLEQREARYEAALKAYERQQEEIARVTRFIERFRYKNTKASQVQSRIKMLEKMPRLEPPVSPMRAIRLRFPQPEPSGRIVATLAGIDKSYGSEVVFRGMSLTLERGEKIALVGPNGAGKSTLMRILAGEEPFQRGTRELGLRVGIEFFAQDQADRLPPGRTLLEETTARAPVSLVPQVRNLLGAFLFRGEDVEKKIQVLSGGERNRYALLLMLLRPANLLLLDEPTNHLDIEAQEVLLHALQDYQGTLVFVSHDHHFISRLAGRIVEVGGGGVRSHPGDYESYLWRRKQEEEGSAGGAAGVAETAASARTAVQAPRRTAGDDRRGQRRLGEVEAKITTLEDRRAKLEQLMGGEGFYRDVDKSRFYLEEHRGAMEELTRLYEEWHSLQDEAP